MGCLIIIVAITLCLSSIGLVLDRVCIGALAFRVPVYPNSKIVYQEHSLVSVNGWGSTLTVYHTADATSVVQSWVGREVGQKSSQAAGDAGLTDYYRYTRLSWSVDAAEDGNGTDIQIFVSCFAG